MGDVIMLRLLSLAIFAALSCLAIPSAAREQAVVIPTLDTKAFAEIMQQGEQVIVGVVQKGQCGQPCELVEKMIGKLMVKMDGFFKAGIVDVRTAVDTGVAGDEQTIQSMFNVSTIPLVFIYKYGPKNVKEAMMMGQEAIGQLVGAYDSKQTTPALQQQVHNTFLQFLPTKVERVNRGSLKEWLQKDPLKARVLLVTSKKSTPPMFTKLSLNYAPGVLFGELRESDAGAVAELETLGGPKIAKFPKLLFGRPMKEGWAAPTEVYSGALNLKAIGEAVAKIDPGKPVPELLSEDTLKKECTSKGGICVVAVLPQRFDKHLAIFKAAASRWYGEGLVNFVWVNEEKQEKWVEAFKVEYFPGMAVLNARKKLYATFVGTFTNENIRDFILKVMAGKEKLSKLDNFPTLLEVDKTMPQLNMKEL